MSNNVCYFCDETERLQQHHIVPRRFDGSNNEENLVKLCPTCHDKIESLYNKRFYNAVGATKNQGSTMGECDIPECTGQAQKSVNGPWKDEYYICEGHNECGYSECPKSGSVAIKGREGFNVLCSEHGRCSYGNCEALADLYGVTQNFGKHIPYCETHYSEMVEDNGN